MTSYSGENSYGHEKAEFSPEIFDYILSFLDVEDAVERRALAQCLLVSRAFCSLSRYHLFAKVTIKDGGVDDGEIKQGSKLLQVLKNDPLHDIHPLALQVRSLEVSFSDATRTFNWIGEPSLWRDTLHKSLPAVLDVLQNLQAFRLRFEQSMNWKELGKFLHDSLTRLFASPRLTSVSISKVYNFRPEILCCPNLGELRLDSVWVKSFFASERQLSCLPPLTWSHHSFRYLHTFDARCSDDVLERIRETKEMGVLEAPFSRLRNFTIYMPTVDRDILGEWWAMRSASRTLECLTIDQKIPCLSDSYSRFPGPICLSDFISLYTFILKVSAVPDDPPSALHHLMSLLSLAGCEPTTIRNLVINVNFPVTRDSISAREMPNLLFPHGQGNAAAVWKSIENAILGPAFLCLQKVQFSFRWLSPDENEDDSTENETKSTDVKEGIEVLECICGRMVTMLPKVVSNKISVEADWKVRYT